MKLMQKLNAELGRRSENIEYNFISAKENNHFLQ